MAGDGSHVDRGRAFIDVCALQSDLDRMAGRHLRIDWNLFVHSLRAAALELANGSARGEPRLEAVRVYACPVSTGPDDAALRAWAGAATTGGTGVRVDLVESPSVPGECRACDVAGTPRCLRCRGNAGRTGGTGLDSPLAADLLTLAREDGYDWGVLVSSDMYLIPVVKYLQGRGRRIIHAGFPPVAADLSRACWASIDLGARSSEFAAAPTP